MIRTLQELSDCYQLRILLSKALQNLDDTINDAFIRHAIFGEEIIDLAKEYEIKYETLRKQFYRIKVELRKKYKKTDFLDIFILCIYVPLFIKILFYIKGDKI